MSTLIPAGMGLEGLDLVLPGPVEPAGGVREPAKAIERVSEPLMRKLRELLSAKGIAPRCDCDSTDHHGER